MHGGRRHLLLRSPAAGTAGLRPPTLLLHLLRPALLLQLAAEEALALGAALLLLLQACFALWLLLLLLACFALW